MYSNTRIAQIWGLLSNFFKFFEHGGYITRLTLNWLSGKSVRFGFINSFLDEQNTLYRQSLLFNVSVKLAVFYEYTLQ